MKWVGGAKIRYSQNPHPQVGGPTNRGRITIAEVLLKEQRV